MKKILNIIIISCLFLSCFIIANTRAEVNETTKYVVETVAFGSPDDVKNLIANGYDVNKDYDDNTMLNSAIKSLAANWKEDPSVAIEKIKILIQAGADVNNANSGMTPLSIAVTVPSQLRQVENKALILAASKEKDKSLEDKQKTAVALQNVFKELRKRVEASVLEAINILLDNGADINKTVVRNAAPLHFAANTPSDESLEVLKLLIAKGADLNARDVGGSTPLFVANFAGNDEAIKLLIDAGADVNIKNYEGKLYNEFRRNDISRGLLR